MSSIEERVKKIVVEQLGVSDDQVTTDASFVDDFNRLHPQNWSPSHICVWWTNIAEIAFHAGVKESQKIPKTFTIEIHASDAAVEMSEEGKEGQEGQECVCKLGMKFQKEPTNKAPRLNDLNVNALVGIAMKIRGKENKEKMKKGCVLVGINEIQFDGQSNIHNQRSIILSAVKPIAMELGKAAAEWQSGLRKRGAAADSGHHQAGKPAATEAGGRAD